VSESKARAVYPNEGYIPHVVIFDKSGKPLHHSSGEFDESEISGIFDKALAQ
jgi:hypothetical protein